MRSAQRHQNSPMLLLELRAALKRLGDPVRAPAMQAYMKSAMPYHGLLHRCAKYARRPSPRCGCEARHNGRRRCWICGATRVSAKSVTPRYIWPVTNGHPEELSCTHATQDVVLEQVGQSVETTHGDSMPAVIQSGDGSGTVVRMHRTLDRIAGILPAEGDRLGRRGSTHGLTRRR